jgi:hypothetical protein
VLDRTEVAIVHHRIFLVPIFAVLLVGVAVPLSVPKSHGDDTYGGTSLTISGFLFRGQSDAYLGSSNQYDGIQAGNTLTFNVLFTANSYVYQRNLTMGVKFDWMTNYQNMTGSYIAVYAGQTVTLSLSYTIPALSGQYANLNQVAHTWTLEVWDMPVGASWHGNCVDNNYYTSPFLPMCNSFTNCGGYFCFGSQYHPVAVYNSAQATSYTTKLQAASIIASLGLAFRSAQAPPPGSSAALALYSQAYTQMALADSAYQNGDFTTAQTDYQNALNNANAAQSSLSTIGGGTDTATFTSIWLNSVAILLGGIGAILVGFSGFKYLRGKTRVLQGSAPSAPKV